MASLSFQPWTHDNAQEAALKDVLARVNLERGHFRDITEASLQEEITGEGGLDLSESDEVDEDEEREPEKATVKPTSREELYRVKYDMLQQVTYAHNEVMLALDYVSLVESKDAPAQGKQTMSEGLRQLVPAGTLGTDIWHRMPVDKYRAAEDDALARTVRMESLLQSADSLLGAAKKLEDNVRKETQYWDQVLAVSEKGWNVCRLPHQQSRLGVRFGFSESAPEFARKGVAALKLDSDGTISLERGVGSRPKSLRVTTRKNGKVTGVSKTPDLADDGHTTLEARIRHARDSLFDEELFHEIVRESRLFSSVGVRTKGQAITMPVSLDDQARDSEITLELVALEDGVQHDTDALHNDDDMAQALALVSRLLFSHAHRKKLQKRSEIPAPLSERKDEKTVISVISPLMSLMFHRAAIDAINHHVVRTCSLLSSAAVSARPSLAILTLPSQSDVTCVETLIETLLRPWRSDARIDLIGSDAINDRTPEALNFHIETFVAEPQPLKITLSFGASNTTCLTTFDELITASDALVASRLAVTLTGRIGEGWKCNEREALLTKASKNGERQQQLWITLDSQQSIMALCSQSRKVVWNSDSDASQTGFWDAATEFI